MSDYNNPNNFDKYGNPLPGASNVYDPDESTGRAPYVLLGILVLIGIVGGALYFNGSPNGARGGADVAQAPPAASRTLTPTPAAPRTMDSGPAAATPAPADTTTTPAAPAPATPSQQ